MSVRFAPSPTGDFHVGNFRTAWISHWWAKQLKMPWVVRFEDIDVPRVIAGAMDRQLDEMRSFGLVPDVLELQSERRERHWKLFEQALRAGVIYPCACSRREVRTVLAAMASAPHQAESVYSGHCRELDKLPKHDLPTIAWRFRSVDATGRDDFIVARTAPELNSEGCPEAESFVPAYNWACAIDDHDGAHALLVRAVDLEQVVEQQRTIQRWVVSFDKERRESLPAVYHCALVVQNDGHRLEKRTVGVTLEELQANGWSVEAIVKKFEASFSAKKEDYVPGKVFSETVRQLTLNELGF